jgi:hypothetical protein
LQDTNIINQWARWVLRDAKKNPTVSRTLSHGAPQTGQKFGATATPNRSLVLTASERPIYLHVGATYRLLIS